MPSRFRGDFNAGCADNIIIMWVRAMHLYNIIIIIINYDVYYAVKV